ncbi:DUF1697 domain-containing protein [Dactylosporangium vinaceum]|uniref:DUF1697 domain-containing protein n=1 Tax=Dactylosporangium vinaceum TaxID=53362 RepID=A0ABV5MLJ1_9ACTN|nr:DUF1697 domain-containing protein [Dactylosporangium vinaceum]UAB93903.1 DUF1697 domain-containing protein [Dactylosporangium vinaceum]
MAGYAVLLKGINVGGNKKVAMADLRKLLTSLGFTDVATLLQSGNAVFTCADDAAPDQVAARIEQAIQDELGMTVRCLVRTGPELRAVIDGHPLAEVATNGSRMMAHFLSDVPAPALLAEFDPATLDPERIVLGDRVIYQWCPDGVSDAPMVGPQVEKRLKVTVTARNWNTVTKLAAMLGA